MVLFLVIMSRVNATSFAVNAWPSVHFASPRTSTDSSVPSAFQENDLPSRGFGAASPRRLLKKNSGSKIVPGPSMSVGENGLKLTW